MPLAGTPAALRQEIARRLQHARVICLQDDERRRGEALTLLEQTFGTQAQSETSEEAVLVLTSDCLAELESDPAWCRDHLDNLRARRPRTPVIFFSEEAGPTFLDIDRLIESVEERIAAQEQLANGASEGLEP